MREDGRWWCLNGVWSFAFDDGDAGRRERWHEPPARWPREIVVPFCPESELSGIGEGSYHDVVWYGRRFEAPERSERDRVLLHFGAVDYLASVWVGGQLAATHEGGHTPFCADITNLLDVGENLVVVRAEDPGRDPSIPRGKQDWQEQPSQIYYSRTTGIWQTVWMEMVDRLHLSDLRLTPDLDAAAVHVVATLAAHEPGVRVRATASIGGEPAGQAWLSLDEARSEAEGAIALASTTLHAWSPDRPALYDLTIELFDAAGTVRDHVKSYFGVRKIEAAGGRVLLNGEPLFLRLVLDQGYWPDGLMTAPSDEALRTDIELAKAMGFNGARKHQKVEDPRWLYWADRLGFLVWGEMANAHHRSPRYLKRITGEWQSAITRDYNHPCIIAWVALNESWGGHVLGPDGRSNAGEFLAAHASAMYFLTRSLDDTRLVVSNDGWEHTFSDLCTIHDYGSPEQLAARVASVESLLSDTAPPVYAAGFGYSGQPFVVSEYGGLFCETPGEGIDYALVAGAEELERSLEALTSVLHSSPILAGFCYTQLTDVGGEPNGLLRADRTPKLELERIRRIIDRAPG